MEPLASRPGTQSTAPPSAWQGCRRARGDGNSLLRHRGPAWRCHCPSQANEHRAEDRPDRRRTSRPRPPSGSVASSGVEMGRIPAPSSPGLAPGSLAAAVVRKLSCPRSRMRKLSYFVTLASVARPFLRKTSKTEPRSDSGSTNTVSHQNLTPTSTYDYQTDKDGGRSPVSLSKSAHPRLHRSCRNALPAPSCTVNTPLRVQASVPARTLHVSFCAVRTTVATACARAPFGSF